MTIIRMSHQTGWDLFFSLSHAPQKDTDGTWNHSKPRRLYRRHELHADLAALRVDVLLDPDADGHLVKHGELDHIALRLAVLGETALWEGDAVVLWIKRVLVLLESDEALNAEPGEGKIVSAQAQTMTKNSLTSRQRQQCHSGSIE